MKKLKTSTKIALNFIIYVFLIFAFAVIVNFFYLYTWTNHSYDEINETINREYTEIYVNNAELKTNEEKFNKLKEDIFDI